MKTSRQLELIERWARTLNRQRKDDDWDPEERARLAAAFVALESVITGEAKQ
jgi:hypothetical protein